MSSAGYAGICKVIAEHSLVGEVPDQFTPRSRDTSTLKVGNLRWLCSTRSRQHDVRSGSHNEYCCSRCFHGHLPGPGCTDQPQPHCNKNYRRGAAIASGLKRSLRHSVKVALPYRFKAGGSGNMAPIATQHHHRSTTKQPQKAFKSRHASKGALKELSKGTTLPCAISK